jgi:transposase
MTHLVGHDRCQTLLLPESLDDYVGPENPVRFVEAFVDGLDLAAAGFGRVRPKETGRPGYAPSDLLKLYIYGYLTRIRSSRRLEAETHRNVEVIWLLRHLKPDFKTIADFRRDNRNAFHPVFREFVLLCRLWVPKISSGAGADASMGYPDGGMTNLLSLLGGFLVGLFRSRAAREAEIAFLRQQLLVATRSTPARLRLRTADRLVFVWLWVPKISSGAGADASMGYLMAG